jgi:hypothetical protein
MNGQFGALRHAHGMEVELLVVPDCPHETTAYDLIHSALKQLDLRASIITTVIETDEHAVERRFQGSPTILVNGRDPFSQPGAPVGMACRMYETPAGLAGVPPLDEFCQALALATPARHVRVNRWDDRP